MKKISKIFLLIFLSFLFVTAPTCRAESRDEDLSRDLDKQRELVEIWKDHVRTLTHERDEAYQEIDTLKSKLNQSGSQSRALKKGEVEFQYDTKGLEQNFQLQTQKLAELTRQKETADQRIQDLSYQLQNLQSKNVSVDNSGGFSAELKDLQSENKLLQVRGEKLKLVEKELQETQNYFTSLVDKLEAENKKLQADQNRIMTEKEESLRRAENLESKFQSLENQADQIDSMKQELSGLKTERESLQKAYATLESHYKLSEERVGEISSKYERLELSHQELQAREEGYLKAIRRLKTSVQTYLHSAEKLKDDFESVSTIPTDENPN